MLTKILDFGPRGVVCNFFASGRGAGGRGAGGRGAGGCSTVCCGAVGHGSWP